jgi:hypothetical protein
MEEAEMTETAAAAMATKAMADGNDREGGG